MEIMLRNKGREASTDILRKALDKSENPKQALQDGVTPDEDDEWEFN
jgi:hypothetical protein